MKYSDGFDGVASALAHPGRRLIVDRLRAGPATTTELARLLDIGLPAVTKHLTLLTGAAVVRSSKAGRVVTHELQPAALTDWSTWLLGRRSFWHHQLDAPAAPS